MDSTPELRKLREVGTSRCGLSTSMRARKARPSRARPLPPRSRARSSLLSLQGGYVRPEPAEMADGRGEHVSRATQEPYPKVARKRRGDVEASWLGLPPGDCVSESI